MPLLIDVDAFSKLAHWRILPELPTLTGEQWSTLSTLGSLVFRAQRASVKPDLKLFQTTMAAQAAVSALSKMACLPDVEPRDLSAFQDVVDIDAGEAVLLAAMSRNQNLRLLTGDKRALRSLSRADHGLRSQYTGRVILLEQVILCALELYGIHWLRERICVERGIDTAIEIVMGSRCDAVEQAVREGLLSYIQEMSMLCNPALVAAKVAANG